MHSEERVQFDMYTLHIPLVYRNILKQISRTTGRGAGKIRRRQKQDNR